MSEMSIRIETDLPEIGLEFSVPGNDLGSEQVITVQVSGSDELYSVVEEKAASFVLLIKCFKTAVERVSREVWHIVKHFKEKQVSGGRRHFAFAGGLRL